MATFLTSRRRFVAGTALTGAVASIGRAPAKAAQFEFRCASNVAVDHPSSVRGRQMWAAVERESGGRVRTQFFPASILGGDQAQISQLRLGALHFYIGFANFPSLVPSVEVAQVGFAFKNEDEALHVMDGSLGDYIRKEFATKGFYVLPKMWASGMRQITSSSHPIRVPDDLSAFKIRVILSKITVDFFKTLGANPTPLSVSEVYTALQTKVVDGEDMPLAGIETLRLFEVQKYLSMSNHTWSGLALVANAEVWKSMPTELQDVIERNNTKYSMLERRDTKLLNASTGDKLSRQGLTAYTIDSAPFRARLRSYYATWSGEFGPTVWSLLQSSVSGKLG